MSYDDLPRSHGWLYRNVSANPNVPVVSGHIVCPEGVRPGELIKLAGWPMAGRDDGALTLKGRPLTPKEEARHTERAVQRAIAKLEELIPQTPSAEALAHLWQSFRSGEAWLHMTVGEQESAALQVKLRSEELGTPSDIEERESA